MDREERASSRREILEAKFKKNWITVKAPIKASKEVRSKILAYRKNEPKFATNVTEWTQGRGSKGNGASGEEPAGSERVLILHL